MKLSFKLKVQFEFHGKAKNVKNKFWN